MIQILKQWKIMNEYIVKALVKLKNSPFPDT